MTALAAITHIGSAWYAARCSSGIVAGSARTNIRYITQPKAMNSMAAIAAGIYHPATGRGLNSSSMQFPLMLRAKLLPMHGERKQASKTPRGISAK